MPLLDILKFNSMTRPSRQKLWEVKDAFLLSYHDYSRLCFCPWDLSIKTNMPKEAYLLCLKTKNNQ